ncbi:hypothetical protein KC345_g10847 [Hortaea werneckii]|nr:hypothetical protein KC345_g10847 [Hortaea werneckii]
MLKTYKRERNMRGGLAFSVVLPDFRGSLESGFSSTVEAMIDEMIQQVGHRGSRSVNTRQITLLPGSFLTPADVMELKEIISAFGFEVIALPDISTSLSGHLLTGFSPLTRGGVPLDSMLQSLQSGLTIAIGGSMERPARRLHNALGTPYKVFEGAMGLKASDELLHFLHQISGEPVPLRYCWQRENLLDSMLDAHFQFAGMSAVAALEPDHLYSVSGWLDELGVEQKALIASYETPLVAGMEHEIWIGDLDDAEVLGKGADLWISNSHGIAGAERIDAAFMPAGFPVWSELGAYMSVSVGYRGAMEWNDGIRVNAHFGQSPMFAVYNVTKAGGELVELRKLPVLLNQDEAGKIDSRLESIGDCTLIFIMQIGASAAARVTRRKIMPVKVPVGSPIDEQVKRLVEMLQGKPPMWLAKVLRAEEEGISEGGEADGTHG